MPERNKDTYEGQGFAGTHLREPNPQEVAEPHPTPETEERPVEENATGPEGEWVEPDEEALYEITKAVSSDLAKGEDKEKVAEWLALAHGWPEHSAIGFVGQVEHERQERMLNRRLIRWLGTSLYVLLFAAIGGSMFAILGLPGAMGGALFGVIGYCLEKVMRFYKAQER